MYHSILFIWQLFLSGQRDCSEQLLVFLHYTTDMAVNPVADAKKDEGVFGE